ncbi:MAG: Mov34/MPN/PAD-1 family protein [Chloroflexota bacterium]
MNSVQVTHNLKRAPNSLFGGLIDYKVAKGGIPAITASEYEYLWAGNGIFVRAQTSVWEAQLRIASFCTSGLTKAKCYFKWTGPKIPAELLQEIYAGARAACGPKFEHPIETMVRIAWEPNQQRYKVVRPPQNGNYSMVTTNDVGDANTIVEIHSHHEMSTYFSRVDDADHTGKRIYGVIGNFRREQPGLLLRFGIHGHRCEIPISDIFEDQAVFKDAFVSN